MKLKTPSDCAEILFLRTPNYVTPCGNWAIWDCSNESRSNFPPFHQAAGKKNNRPKSEYSSTRMCLKAHSSRYDLKSLAPIGGSIRTASQYPKFQKPVWQLTIQQTSFSSCEQHNWTQHEEENRNYIRFAERCCGLRNQRTFKRLTWKWLNFEKTSTEPIILQPSMQDDNSGRA